jgi:hypothetical protein
MFHLSEDVLSRQHSWGSQHSSDLDSRISMLHPPMASCIDNNFLVVKLKRRVFSLVLDVEYAILPGFVIIYL